MKWRNLLTRRWPVLALALLGLFGAVAIAQSASEPFFVLANDKEDADETGWLGVYIEDVDSELADEEGLPSAEGVYVNGVVDDSPAQEAGLKKGDVILKFNGQEARSVRRLTRLIEDTKPKTKVDIEILRDGDHRVLACEIGADDHEVWAWSDGDWDFDPPHVVVPDMPDVPSAPRAYSFSLGQLSNSYIGVGLYDMSEQLAAALGATDGGALINNVEEDSPAEKAGLKAGDVIVEIDHKKMYDTDDVRKAIQKKEDGEMVTVRVLRGKNEDMTVDVKVESNDTWSGIGAPHFKLRHDNTGSYEWRDDMREGLSRVRKNLKENGDEWREELQEQMRELREELKALQKELRENR